MLLILALILTVTAIAGFRLLVARWADPAPLGSMSERWLAEHRSSRPMYTDNRAI